MSNGNDMMIRSIAGLIKKVSYKNEWIFPKPQRHDENIKVKIDLNNDATKEDIKNITHVDTSSFALKTNFLT